MPWRVGAAKVATTTIPIVFVMGSDPIKAGVVASLNRPEGNVTGVSFLINSLGTKRVELISQLVPRASTIGMLANPNNPDAEIETRDAQAAARALGRKLLVVKASPGSDLEVAFATLVEQGVGALAVSGDPFFEAHRDKLIALAARNRMPAIYVLREDPAAGGLISYGTSISAAFRQGGVYVGSILKGAKPSDLPVMQSTKFELVINLKTAKALGLDVPPATGPPSLLKATLKRRPATTYACGKRSYASGHRRRYSAPHASRAVLSCFKSG